MHGLLIPVFVVLLVVLASTGPTWAQEECAAPQEGVSIHTEGTLEVIFISNVTTAEKCISEDGFCVESGDQCAGTIKILQYACDDLCTCCLPGCPSGFFMSSGSTQCFQAFTDEDRNWNEARDKCEAEGLIIAKPATDAVAVALRKDLLDAYGHGSGVWLDARGDGSRFIWQRDMTELSGDSHLWMPGPSAKRFSTIYCLELDVNEEYWSSHPGQPYSSKPCHWEGYTLCELNR